MSEGKALPYLEPECSFEKLEIDESNIKSQDGLNLDIEFLAGVGFAIELRYDQQDQSVRRQVFTGAQETLQRTPCELAQSEKSISCRAEGIELEFERSSGALTLRAGSETLLQSVGSAFFTHDEEVEVYEGKASLKFNDFSLFLESMNQGNTYRSRMSRFQYKRPEGVVLGLPGQTGNFNRNGHRFNLYNTDQTSHTPDRQSMYQSWPILLHQSEQGQNWIAVFHDNPARTAVDLGDFYPEKITFESITGNSRIFFCVAESLPALSHKLSTLLGGCPFPPLWAFGYQQCRWSYMSTDEIRDVVQQFEKNQIPLDCMYFDIDYMDGFRVFTKDNEQFSDLSECTQELQDKGIQSVCIVDPGVKVDGNFDVYKRVLAEGSLLKNKEGKPFAMECWAGNSVLPDFGDKGMRELWSDIQAKWQADYGFTGIWNDMNEPSNFQGHNASNNNALTARGPLRDEYNLYGYYMASASRLGQEKFQEDKRSIVITRSGYPGVQQNAIIWHGDNQAWWEHLRLALETTVQYSLCGAFYTGPDAPGFFDNPTDDLAVRFFQLASWLPFFRGHSNKTNRSKEPYAFGEEAQQFIAEAIRQRYSLLREWYSGFELACREGRSPYEPCFDDKGALLRDQFLLFDKLLVAPVTEREATKRLMYLPEGAWYRLGDTKQRVDGNRWQVVDVDLSITPVFVRAGTILTRNEPGPNSKQTFSSSEQFEVYLDSRDQATGYWYGDDGISKDEGSAVERLALSWDNAGKTVVKSSLS